MIWKHFVKKTWFENILWKKHDLKTFCEKTWFENILWKKTWFENILWKKHDLKVFCEKTWLKKCVTHNDLKVARSHSKILETEVERIYSSKIKMPRV